MRQQIPQNMEENQDPHVARQNERRRRRRPRQEHEHPNVEQPAQQQAGQQNMCVGIKRLNIGAFDVSRMDASDNAYHFQDYFKRVRAALSCYPMTRVQRYVHFVNEMGPQMQQLIRAQGLEEENEIDQHLEVLANKIIAHFGKYTDKTKCMTAFMNVKMTAEEEGHGEVYHDRVMKLAVKAEIKDPIVIKDRYLHGEKFGILYKKFRN